MIINYKKEEGMKNFKTKWNLCIIAIATIGLISLGSVSIAQDYDTKDLNEQLVMATLWMQKSAEYRALCYQTFNLSKLLLDAYLSFYSGPKPVAVVVDDALVPAADGSMTRMQRTPEELDRLSNLVKDAVGFVPEQSFEQRADNEGCLVEYPMCRVGHNDVAVVGIEDILDADQCFFRTRDLQMSKRDRRQVVV